MPSEGVGVPHDEGLVPPVERSCFLAQTVVVFVGWHFLPGANSGAVPGHRPAGSIPVDDSSLQIHETDLQGRFLNPYSNSRTQQIHGFGSLFHLHGNGGGAVRQNRPGVIRGKSPFRSQPDANDGFPDGQHSDLCFTRLQFHAVREDFYLGYLAEVLPAARKSGHRGGHQKYCQDPQNPLPHSCPLLASVSAVWRDITG